jgi:hypothetical protein
MGIFLLTLAAIFPFTATITPLPPQFDADPLGGRYGAYQLGDIALANEVSNAGISYLILPYRWEQIEFEQDVFLLDEFDELYDEVLSPNNLTAAILIRTGQCWATDNTVYPDLGPLNELASTPPLDYDDYYDMVYALVDHMKGKIDQFIIENDPLTKVSWYGTPDDYKLLVNTAHDAAKAANPDCVIIANKFPAMAFGHLIARDLLRAGKYQAAVTFWNGYYSRRAPAFQVANLGELLDWLELDFSVWMDSFAEAIMQPDQAENLDVIGFNFYLHYEYIDEIVGWLKMKMAKNGFSRPLWDLEHGVKDERMEVSDYEAAGELVKGYVITHSLGINQISWYPFTIDSAGHNFEYLKPMYDFANEEFLPTYLAMQILSSQFAPTHRIESVFETAYDRYAFKDLRTGNVDLDVIWSDADEGPLSLLFRRPATQAVVTNLFGSEVETIPNVNDTLTIQVDRAPRYIRWLFE